MKSWFWEVMVAVDQLFNAILGGSADETISSRCGKRLRSVKAAERGHDAPMIQDCIDVAAAVKLGDDVTEVLAFEEP